MFIIVKVWRIPGVTSSSVGSSSGGNGSIIVVVVVGGWWVVVVISSTSKEKCLNEKASDWACEDKFNILYFPRSFLIHTFVST